MTGGPPATPPPPTTPDANPPPPATPRPGPRPRPEPKPKTKPIVPSTSVSSPAVRSRPPASAPSAPAPFSSVFHRVLSAEAFFLLYGDRYLGYAGLRLRDRSRSEAVVGEVLDSLAAQWPAVLRSASPEALAWRRLGLRLSDAERARGAEADRLHLLLRPAQADLVMLHRVMGLAIEEAATLMGLHASAAAGLLRAAERQHPVEVGRQVRRLRRLR